MIGSEEEQKEEEVEVAPVARRRRRRREGRCSSVASFMGEGFRWKEFDAGRGRESREMKKERRSVWNSSMDGAATTCCFIDNLAEVLMEFINLQAIIDKFTTEMRFKSERRLRDYTSYPPLAEGRVSSLYSVELINCVMCPSKRSSAVLTSHTVYPFNRVGTLSAKFTNCHNNLSQPTKSYPAQTH